MTNDRNNRLGLLSLVFCLVLNYPILSVFDQQRLLYGMPLLFLYFFTSWLMLIAFTIWMVRKKR
ncbi:MAG: hypothetical protein IT270_02400 [Saprospiraceae bacterium]|nr:hypothetical protein [Saprospiraceae bacterium]